MGNFDRERCQPRRFISVVRVDVVIWRQKETQDVEVCFPVFFWRAGYLRRRNIGLVEKKRQEVGGSSKAASAAQTAALGSEDSAPVL